MGEFTRSRLYELYDKCNIYGHYYHDLDNPIVPDEIYDQNMQEIKLIEEQHPEWIRADSPLNHVSGTAYKKKLEKVQHPEQLQSLDDKFSREELEKWYNTVLVNSEARPFFDVEAKVDGLSVSLEYINGVFTKGATRGDGWMGEDVTENLLRVKGIPQKLSGDFQYDNSVLRVRAEIVMYNDRFKQLNAEREISGEDSYANPRNAAAGILRTLDPLIVEKSGLSAVAFCILYAENISVNDSVQIGVYQTSNLDILTRMGFTTVPYAECNSIDEIWDAIDQLDVKRHSFPYWTDGAVIKVNSIKHQIFLGETSKYPKWAVAYKYKTEEKETKVINISVQTGRTGVLTPKVEFEPISIGGTTIRYATLHNIGYINALGGITIGDIITVSKAAEIIPQVLRVNLDRRPQNAKLFSITICPSCNTPAVFKISDEIETAYCPNINCPAQKTRYFEFVTSRNVLNIVGMGPAVINTLVNAGLLKKKSDLFYLKQYRDRMISLPSMGKAKVDNILQNIEQAKGLPLYKIITSLGISGCGNYVGKILEQMYPDMDTIMKQKETDFIQINGIGPTLAKTIANFFQNPDNIEFISELKHAGVNMNSKKQSELTTSVVLKDLNFVITGTLNFLSRQQAIELIVKNGGTVQSGVSKHTNYLIAGENAGSKLKRAQTLEIPVLTESQFINMLNSNS